MTQFTGEDMTKWPEWLPDHAVTNWNDMSTNWIDRHSFRDGGAFLRQRMTRFDAAQQYAPSMERLPWRN